VSYKLIRTRPGFLLNTEISTYRENLKVKDGIVECQFPESRDRLLKEGFVMMEEGVKPEAPKVDPQIESRSMDSGPKVEGTKIFFRRGKKK
jgi:hypothetical protein